MEMKTMKKPISLSIRIILAFLLLLLMGLLAPFIFLQSSGPIFTILFAAAAGMEFYLLIFTIDSVLKLRNIYKNFHDFRDIQKLLDLPPVFRDSDKVLTFLYEDAMRKETALLSDNKLSEYIALQNQINPHFLYNTLESIRSDAICAGLTSLADTVAALSSFFRYTISNKSESFTVEDELISVKNYFTIQKYRFGDRLNLLIHYEGDQDAILQTPLPKLCLQPIIENAIRHGLEQKVEGGTIDLTFQTTRSRLLISVFDNGVGMEQEQLDKINHSLTEDLLTSVEEQQQTHRSIALKNVNTRIQLLFGPDYGIHIFSQKNIGTTVQITIPFHLPDKQKEDSHEISGTDID